MKDETRVTTAGRHPEDHHGAVNPPVYHASTILFPTLHDLETYEAKPVTYGRRGTPGTYALEEAMTELEGGHMTVLTPSGLSACTMALSACLDTGDHLLMTDSVYEPTRAFCDRFLTRMGIETTYYDPRLRAGIARLIRPNTRVIFTESPGSRTFEVQDIPAIVGAARAAGDILVLIDNTWATPLYLKPLALGADVSIGAATKYIVGHSDAMLGTITANERAAGKILAGHRQFGLCAGPDDVFFALRGLRTLAVRLKQHWETGLKLAAFVGQQPEVAAVLHPALPEDPGYEIWSRDFRGATGLFGAILHPCAKPKLAAMLDGFEHFGMGWSWGGFESLVIAGMPKRTATPWPHPGPLLRFHAGLEHPDDLIADLADGFARFRRTPG